MNRSFPVLLLAALVAVANAAMAQAPTASVVGRVTDASAAPIPDANIQVRNVNTNEIRTAKSSAQGEYTIADLPPGLYEVSIDKAGFKQLRQTNLELRVDQTARVDARLALGAVSETVSVTANVPLMNTETATRGDVVTPQEIAQIPLNGRDFDDLVFNVPGAQNAEQGGKGSPYVFNGARADASNVLIEGVNDESPRDAGAQIHPPLDSLQEFKVNSSNYSAEYGRLAGGVVTMAMKSGGNQLHGSAFEFNRNNVFDANDYFANAAGAPKSKLRRNQFGATLTGPVVLPRLYNGHDHTFFLFSWESFRETSGSPTSSTVPTPLELQGDFSQSRLKGTAVALKNPFASGPCAPTGATPITRTQVPMACFNPISVQLLKYFPAPNIPGVTMADTTNYFVDVNSVNHWDNFVWKLDQVLTAKDRLTATALQRWARSTNPFSGSTLGLWGATTRHVDGLYTISETRVFSPRLVNQIRFGLTRTSNLETSNDAGTNFAQQLGISGTTSDPRVAQFPEFTITGFPNIGDHDTNPVQFTLNDYDFNDVATWTLGTHSISFGGDILRVQYYQPTNSDFNGLFKFSGSQFTGDPMADFLLGLTSSTTLKIGTVTNHIFSTAYSLFLQDNYQVRPDLTLNLGLRYEMDGLPYEKQGQLSNYVPSLGKVILAGDSTVPNLGAILAQNGLTGFVGLASDNGLPKTIAHNRYHDVSPRVGLAWRPFGGNRTVVRAGYGIFYTGSRLSAIRTDLTGGFPFAITQTFTGPRSNPTEVTLSNPFPASLAKDGGTTTANGFDIQAPSPYLQSWNLTVERNLGKDIALEAGYVGSKGTHLGRKYNINQVEGATQSNPTGARPYTLFNDIEYYYWYANSNYNALILTLRRNFKNGLFFRFNYAYAKSLDDNSGLNYAGDGGYAGAQDSLDLGSEYGRSTFDIRHNISGNWVYALPLGRNIVLRGWQLAGDVRVHSGQPFTPTLSNSQDKGEATRPNRLCPGALPNPTPAAWFNLACFETTQEATPNPPPNAPPTYSNFFPSPNPFGNSGRDILDGPGLFTMDFGLSRNFHFGEQRVLQFRWEAFNALNRANFQLPAGKVDSNAAAQISATNAPRIMQFGVRFQF